MNQRRDSKQDKGIFFLLFHLFNKFNSVFFEALLRLLWASLSFPHYNDSTEALARKAHVFASQKWKSPRLAKEWQIDKQLQS